MNPIECRDDLKHYIMTMLGGSTDGDPSNGLLDIEITDSQVDYIIDDIMQRYQYYAKDGQHNHWLRLCNYYHGQNPVKVRVPKEVFTIKTIYHSDVRNYSYFWGLEPDKMNLTTQLLYGGYTFDVISYHLAQEWMYTLDRYRDNRLRFEFNKNTNYVDIWFPKHLENPIDLYIETYMFLDPEKWQEVYDDPWIKKMCVATARKQWALNMSKYQGMQMANGWSIDMGTILGEANAEIEKLELELDERMQAPPNFFVG